VDGAAQSLFRTAARLFYHKIFSGVWRDIAAAEVWGWIDHENPAMPSRHWQQKAKERATRQRMMACAEAKTLMRDAARRYRLMGPHCIKAVLSRRRPGIAVFSAR
jgi:hypothetical protein